MGRQGFSVWVSLDITAGRSLRPWPGAVPTHDPVAVARALCAAGARRLHVADRDGGSSKQAANRAVVLAVTSASPCPVQVSGGLRSGEEVGAVLAAGAERAVVGLAALDDRAALRRVLQRHPGGVAALLDVRGEVVSGDVPLADAVRLFEDVGASAFVVTDLEREGTMSGAGVPGLRAVAALTQVPLVAAGGIASLADLVAVRSLQPVGVSGAIVGRSVYEGRLTLRAAHRVADERPAGGFA